MSKSNNNFSLSNFLHFFTSYILTEVVTFAAAAIPLILLSPLLGGIITKVANAYSETHASSEDPIDVVIDIFLFIVFYIVFAVVYLYRNKERCLIMQKHSVDNFSLINEVIYYYKTYGIYDVLYYCMCLIPCVIFLYGGMEGQIINWETSSIVRYIIGIPMFIVCYTICLIIVINIWNKKRPEYLKKGYIERENL